MTEYNVSKLTSNLYLLRFKDTSTKYFEGLWEIPEGIMYNSYVYTSNEGAIVFDTWKMGLGNEFLEALRNIVDLRDVRYIVVHHMEPDHSGILKTLVEKADPIVLGHPLVKNMAESFYSVSMKFRPVKDGEEIVFDDEKIIFYHTPWLHWPETIMSYITSWKMLLTCDAFGSYGVFKEVWADELSGEDYERYLWYAKKYFANVIGIHYEWVVKNLEKLVSRGVTPSLVLPSHGLLLRGDSLDYMYKKYKSWGHGEPEQGKTLLIYTSMYGFVERTVKIIREYFSGLNQDIDMIGFTDSNRPSISDVIGEAFDAENIILASATYDADLYPLMKHIASLITRKTPRGKKVAIIAQYGWGGKAGKILEEMMSTQGFKVVGVVEFKAGEEERYRDKIIGLIESLKK
ncbi:FprA family A-type flavoprotein [Desulfurococcus amylolyticus]|uniref:FprA family A-type flavoprotein n=1 Tax=Desulfurococcus amylolyticus TaxID=94694 RepID=UPI000B13FF38|nr:FprA family A-type flavoprotein [Desulfurococcus amylolyticus]